MTPRGRTRIPPRTPGFLLATALLLLLTPAVSAAQGIGSTNRLHGYFKTIPLYFGSSSSSPVGYSFPSNGFLDYSRLRITSRSSREGGLYMNTAVEVETFAGELPRLSPNCYLSSFKHSFGF